MPLGHNRRDPEFGKIVPLGRSPEGPEGTAGLGPAILLSLGLHALIGLMFWHSLVGRGHENPAVTRIIDTRVRNPAMEMEVCLSLLDSPKPGLKKASTQPPVTDPSKTSRAAGAESSKPLQSSRTPPLLTGASKTQPWPPETTISSQEENFSSGLGGRRKT